MLVSAAVRTKWCMPYVRTGAEFLSDRTVLVLVLYSLATVGYSTVLILYGRIQVRLRYGTVRYSTVGTVVGLVKH